MATTDSESRPHGASTRSMPLEQNPRIPLLRRLRGTQVVVPDIESMVAHWPRAQHPEVEWMVEEIDRVLQSVFTLPKYEARLRKMREAKLGEFGASTWPYARFEALRPAVYLLVFLSYLFLEIDTKQYSPMATNDEAVADSYLKANLSGVPGTDLSDISTNSIIACFKPAGNAIVEFYDEGKLAKLRLASSFAFVRMCDEERRVFAAPFLPTAEEYMRKRMGSSGVMVFGTFVEFAYGISLPKEVCEDEAIKCIWDKTNVVVFTINDILSLNKEMAHSPVVDSLIPLLTVELGSAQAAIEHACHTIRFSVHAIDLAAERILAREFSTPGLRDDIRKFIDGAKYLITSSLSWSLVTPRYGLNAASMDGGLRMTL
ncbi:hypothetical protein NUW58_g8876 [Xylaria curta]|uniref:Uncharacterized protein n=1 Tax=Xylaria curta TaxID=42375 RepID=A0ACC1N4X4_9PEZI|nr:hypothetical protein NUW58_g8876 [Xylaria curta]